MSQDMLLFRSAPEFAAGQRSYGWTGEWPPPERMWIATGRVTGMEQPFDPATADPMVLNQVIAQMDVVRYVRYSASELGEEIREMSHVFRGAQYVPEPEEPS
jgi:hypothetical protein